MKVLTILSIAVMGVLGQYLIDGAPVAPGDDIIVGKFELISDPSAEDYGRYLAEMQVSDQYQQVLRKLKLNIEIEKDGENKYTYKIHTPFVTRKVSFEIGKEIDDQYVDGRKYHTTFERQGNNIVIHTMRFEGFVAINKYIFSPEKLEAELTILHGKNGARRIYKRVNEFASPPHA